MFSLAMEELRAEITRLREQVEAVTASEQGARVRLEEEVRACQAHIRAMGEKVEEDHGAVQFQMAELRETVTAAAAATGLTPQTFAVPVAAKEQMHRHPKEGVRGTAHLQRKRAVAGVAFHYI